MGKLKFGFGGFPAFPMHSNKDFFPTQESPRTMMLPRFSGALASVSKRDNMVPNLYLSTSMFLKLLAYWKSNVHTVTCIVNMHIIPPRLNRNLNCTMMLKTTAMKKRSTNSSRLSILFILLFSRTQYIYYIYRVCVIFSLAL